MAILVFGASGAIGGAVIAQAEAVGVAALGVGREWRAVPRDLKFDGVVWAQGVNASGAIDRVDDETWARLWDANVMYVAESLQMLLDRDQLTPGARLVIVSSVWEVLARPDKVAYVTTKAAVGGLVRALAADLGPKGFAVNGVLPGVLDSPMTRRQLSAEQVAGVERQTPLGRLVSLDEVAEVIRFLAFGPSHGMTGQSVRVDGGWSVVRNV